MKSSNTKNVNLRSIRDLETFFSFFISKGPGAFISTLILLLLLHFWSVFFIFSHFQLFLSCFLTFVLSFVILLFYLRLYKAMYSSKIEFKSISKNVKFIISACTCVSCWTEKAFEITLFVIKVYICIQTVSVYMILLGFSSVTILTISDSAYTEWVQSALEGFVKAAMTDGAPKGGWANYYDWLDKSLRANFQPSKTCGHTSLFEPQESQYWRQSYFTNPAGAPPRVRYEDGHVYDMQNDWSWWTDDYYNRTGVSRWRNYDPDAAANDLYTRNRINALNDWSPYEKQVQKEWSYLNTYEKQVHITLRNYRSTYVTSPIQLSDNWRRP
jgi:hypothetical protein